MLVVDDDKENYVPSSQVPPMTQIVIQELEEEVKDLKSCLKPRRPPVMSQNHRDLEKLHETVHELKHQLDSREHDILYYKVLKMTKMTRFSICPGRWRWRRTELSSWNEI